MYGNEGKYGISKCRRKRKYREDKGKEMRKEVRWRRDLKRACSRGFWEGKYGVLKEVQEEKESTGILSETQAKKLVGGKIRRGKAQGECGTLGHT